MKKIIISIGFIGIIAILILNSCEKNHVKYGNKRIIGTWKMTLDKLDANATENTTVTYETNSCDFTSSTTKVVSSLKVEQTGNSIHEVSTETTTYSNDGVEPVTENIDTTYTTKNNIELTFNEDGTCSYLRVSDRYWDYDRVYEGHWTWVDSYENKTGIKIHIFDEDITFENMTLFIESLSKDELVCDYNIEYSSNRTQEQTDYCLSDNKDIKRTTARKSNVVYVGKMTMKK